MQRLHSTRYFIDADTSPEAILIDFEHFLAFYKVTQTRDDAQG